MAERDPREQVQVKIRLRELIRARLEAEAAKKGYPLSTEIVRRLEESIRDDDLGRVVFGDRERFGMLATIDRLILTIQMQTGKTIDDRDTRYLVADTIASFLKHAPEIAASLFAGQDPGTPPTLADRYAATLTALIIQKDLERRTGAAEEPATGEAGTKPSDEAA